MTDPAISHIASSASGLSPGKVDDGDEAIPIQDAIRFGFLLHDVSRLRRVVVDRELKPLGITRSQWVVLLLLSRRDGMTQTSLSVDLDLTKVAIGGLLDRLESAGLVERRFDEMDARVRRVFLTRAGHRLVRKIRDKVEAIEVEILGSNTPEEIEIVTGSLRRMKVLLQQKIGEQNED